MDQTRYYLHDGSLWERVHRDLGGQVTGVYRLYADNLEGRPIPISRMMGTEPTGLLYIGGSDEVANRVGKLRGGTLTVYGLEGYRSRPHSAAWKMEKIEGFTDRFPWRGLYLLVDACDSKRKDGSLCFRTHEGRLLSKYRAAWGETPPLNG